MWGDRVLLQAVTPGIVLYRPKPPPQPDSTTNPTLLFATKEYSEVKLYSYTQVPLAVD